MEDYAEQSHFEEDQFAHNGEEFREDFETLDHRHRHHHQQREQFDSEGGFEPEDNINSSGNEIKHSSIVGHRDSASLGKLFVGGISWQTSEGTF
ncbi:hypothetical protein CMV_009346 [Castanea mollissima]|uniref:Uncharacterized protein n=1 Tax=Castanea mollissima TaxID=60419 RepID=A0A8J4VN68_9ROSI|nr:hypothetical protein CMV_009346 [Castanea mollissima]